MILDLCVTLLTIGARVALVTSNKHPHKRYWVHNHNPNGYLVIVHVHNMVAYASTK